MVASSPVLLDEARAIEAMSLDEHAFAWLVATGQLTPITIAGKRQYLYRQLEELARVYRSKQVRS